MTNKKSMKRALISSLLIMAMCFTMLAGTTYAWFTDSVTSANNIIKSGKLDVSLVWADGKANPVAEDTVWTDASDGAIFNYDRWEPGYVDVKHIAIANEGNLALKYKVKIVANGEVSDLADVIDVYYFDPAKQIANREALAAFNPMDTLTAALAGMDTTASGRLAPGAKDVITIALKMQESAGNAYQDKSIGTSFSIMLLATQDTVEEDSFDELYDEDATYPVVSAAEIKDAFAAAQNSDEPAVIILKDNIADGDGLFLTANKNADITIDLNGKELAIDGPAVGSTGTQSQALHLEKGNKVVIKNGTIKIPSNATGIAMAIQNYADLTLDNVVIDTTDKPYISYALSCNCGKVLIKDTTIRVAEGKTAFDVCVTNYYPEGTQVTVEGNSVINGKVEFDVWGTKPAENKSTLTINGGTFNNGYKLDGITLDEAQAMTSGNAALLFA